MFSCEYCEIFKSLYFKRYLWRIASELYWFKVGEIIEKTEMYPETIIEDVFRTQWNICDAAFCKNSCLYLTVTIFAKNSILLVSQGYEYALIKLNRAAISANSFLNYILSLIITLPWDINHKLQTRVFHFKLIHPYSWIHII